VTTVELVFLAIEIVLAVVTALINAIINWAGG
jgi:hypothetical protein